MRISLICLAALLTLTLAAGCEPFETEITLNADGSGRMVQKAVITPAVQQLLTSRDTAPQGFQPILTEEAAEEWRKANGQGPVKLEAYSSIVSPDGVRTIQCTVSFTDLSQLAASVWGLPLRLAVAQTPQGPELQLDDPVRGAALLALPAQARDGEALPQPGAPGYLEFQALANLCGGLGRGLSIRTTLKLSAPAAAVRDAELSADKQAVSARWTIGQDAAAATAWLRGSPAGITLAGVAVPVFPLAQPLTGKRALVFDKREIKPGENYSVRLTYANVSSRRYFSREGDDVGGDARSSHHLSLNLMLNGPTAASLIDIRQYENRSARHEITAIKDLDGNDIAGRVNFNFSPQQYYRGGGEAPREGNIGNGSVTVSLDNPDIKGISLIEGYVTLHLMEEGRLEIRPLRSHLNETIQVPGSTIVFTEIKDKSVVVTVNNQGRSNRDIYQWLRWYAADGKELTRPGMNSRGTGVNYEYAYTMQFPGGFPADGYAVIQYPSRITEAKLPFTLKDVKFP